MRILSVWFKNLNSLTGEWRIDFTHPAYASDGIFAITGPTGAGKTTNLEFLRSHAANPVELASVPHADGRTVSFLLPIEPHRVRGVELRIKVVTVETRLEADKAWRLAFRECDGVVKDPTHVQAPEAGVSTARTGGRVSRTTGRGCGSSSTMPKPSRAR